MTRRLEEFTPLWPAEQKLVDCINAGNMEPCPISGSLPPEDAPRDVRLRASFVRYLALSGCDDCRVPEKGLRVWGAYIEGDGPERAETRGLDLEGCELTRDLGLFKCRFAEPVILRSASLRNLFLNGCDLRAGLKGDRLEAKGNVVLDGVEAHGEVSLLGARLGGNLDCVRARLMAGAGVRALSADRLEAKGNVFMRGLQAHGEIRLLGARLEGNLECDGVQLTVQARDKALNGTGMRVEGTFFLRQEAQIDGVLELRGAEIGHIVDDLACWPQRRGDLLLDRCRYGAFLGSSPVDAVSRARWLSLQNEARWGEQFWPQPWEECARVLREMGHGAAAREILIEKEKRQRAARRERLRREHLYEDAYWHAIWDRILGWTVRYGRQPLLAFAWLGLFLMLGTFVFGHAGATGALKPNLPQIQRAPEWVDCAGGGRLRGDEPSQYACYVQQPAGQSYPRFNAFIYSADTLIPVVSLEMQAYWLPDERDESGKLARWYLWLHIAMGWALTLLAVAGFSGLIKQDST